MSPSSRPPRTAFPSAAIAGSQPGPATGRATGAGTGATGQVRPGMARQRLCAQPGEDPHHRLRVRRHAHPEGVPPGPARGQHLLRRGVHPRGHILDRRVPHSTAAVHKANTHSRECRIPRGSRGAGTAAKHSRRFPPDAALSTAARAASSARTSSAQAGTGL